MSFSNDVKKATEQYRRRMKFIARSAVEQTAEDASVLDDRGGRMPFDTGFLVSSLLASTDGPPQGPTSGEPIQGAPFAASLARWDPLTQVFWMGWTANYAAIQNVRTGFREGAVEKWDIFVQRAAAEAQRHKL